ncbi:MAG: hypothetical protein E6R03_12235 [Hyphomicrobiaceae bacterium]|nr:MAG: hypothetical protein E6R03_12235 [Hyphomicrobiaceae bacterium]
MIEINDELKTKLLKQIGGNYELYVTQRTEFEDIWAVCDYMYRCGQNRAIYEEEREKGANDAEVAEEMAQTASTMFHRQVTQIAANGAAITLSGMPFAYQPVINGQVDISLVEGKHQAEQANTLARYTMKKDGMDTKLIQFWWMIARYGNIPVMIYQKQRRERRSYRIPTYEPGPDGITPVQKGYKKKSGLMWIENHPSLKILPIESIYADVFISNLRDQEVVLVANLKTLSELYRDADADYYDKDAVREITEQDRWDGTTSKELLEKRLENQGVEAKPESVTSLFLTWDVFVRFKSTGNLSEAVADDDKEADYGLWWFTLVGNSPGSAKIIRADKDFDPDNEIPIEMIKGKPDDPDFLYSMSSAQVVRSNYSVECTLKNQAIDNLGLANRPPLIEKEGAVRGTDRTYKKNQLFVVDDIESSIKEMTTRDNTQSIVNLLSYIKEDTQQALSTDKPMVGESFGGRTSALEVHNIVKNSTQPHLISIRYVLSQLFSFYARKLTSYWREYAFKGQVAQIVDEPEYPVVYPENICIDFDVEVSILDNIEQDAVSEQRLNEAVQMIGSNPALMQVVDIEELVKEWLRLKKLPISKIIKPNNESDATAVARSENIMMVQGEDVPVEDGQNHRVHLVEHKAERARYVGVEDSFKDVVERLDAHIVAHEEAEAGVAAAGAAMAAAQQPGAAPGIPTEGQAASGPMAAVLGGA